MQRPEGSGGVGMDWRQLGVDVVQIRDDDLAGQ